MMVYLDEKQIYLDAQLSLSSFSRVVGTNTTYLSTIINQRLGCNFKTLLIRYRIRYACQLIQEGVELPQVGEQSGFGSKSSFYEVFRREVGMTPGEYSKQVHTQKERKEVGTKK